MSKQQKRLESKKTHQDQEKPLQVDFREYCSICHCHIGDGYCKNSNCGRHDIIDVGDAMMKLRDFHRMISTHRLKVAQSNKSDDSSSKQLVNCGSEPANSSLYGKSSFSQQPSDNGGSAEAKVCEKQPSDNQESTGAEVCEQPFDNGINTYPEPSQPPTCELPNGAYWDKCCICGENFVNQVSDAPEAIYCSLTCYGNR